MNIETFDCEIYPNYFLLNSYNIETKEKKSFVIDEYENDMIDILNWIKEKKTRVGHNIISFDNLLLCYLQLNSNWLQECSNLNIVERLKSICDRIINKERNKPWDEDLKKLFKIKDFKYIDTLAIMNTVDRVGLKQASINLKFHNVQELPFEPNSFLNVEEKEIVKQYCFNDCEISALLYERKIPDLELRKEVKKLYNMDVTNYNDTAIAKNILDKYYSEATGLEISKFKDLRSYNKPFYLKEILPKIEFKTKPFQDLYKWFGEQLITEKTQIDLKEEDGENEEIKKSKISYDVMLPNLAIRYALGGLHSIDSPGYFKADNQSLIRDFDFSSYYPNIMINHSIKPRHVDQEFINVLKRLTAERIAKKKEGKKKEAGILKICINSLYGLLGSDFYWLKDTKALLKVTITGQLYLSKLCEELILNNIEVISINTDGILCIVKTEQNKTYEQICTDIQKYTNIEGEYTNYKLYLRRDVNNFISIYDKADLNDSYEELLKKEHLKQKGKYFTTELALNKGLYYPIVAKCLNNYFIKNISIDDTIKKSTNVYDYMASQKVDTSKFIPEISYYDSGKIITKKLQKINRWIITNTGVKFIKVETEKAKLERLEKKKNEGKKITNNDLKTKRIGIEVGSLLTIVNKVNDDNIANYKLDYNFYKKICNDTIEMIKPKFIQTSLF